MISVAASILALTALCPFRVMAQPTTEEVAAWLDHESSAATHFPIEPPFEFVFERLDYARLTPGEVDALGKEITNHPDHPRRGEYAIEKQRLEKGPDKTEIRVFWGGTRNWRLCETTNYPGAALPFVDFGVTPSVGWCLTPTQLSVVDPSGGYPKGRDYSAVEPQATGPASRFFHGGLSILTPLGFVRQSVRPNAGQWTAVYANSERTLEFKGRWSKDDSRGFVTSSRLVKVKDASDIGMGTNFLDWARLPDGIWIAQKVDEVEPGGHISVEYRFISIGPISESYFTELTSLPAPDASDPIRGPLTIKKVYDFRPSKMTATYHDGPAIPPKSLGPSPDHLRLLRYLGWSLCVVLSGLIVVLIARRRISAKQV